MKKIHYLRLALRVFVFLAALAVYLRDRATLDVTRWPRSPLLWVLLCFFFLDFIPRFLPGPRQPIGSQKQYARHYNPPAQPVAPDRLRAEVRRVNLGALRSAAFFLLVTGVFYLLYFARRLDRGEMLLLVLLYSIGDSVCILWFCPFRTLGGNRCCADCRIYNWDMLMNVLPLAVIPCAFSFILLLPAVVYFLLWEVLFHRHPEQFLEISNERLSCRSCENDHCPLGRKKNR